MAKRIEAEPGSFVAVSQVATHALFVAHLAQSVPSWQSLPSPTSLYSSQVELGVLVVTVIRVEQTASANRDMPVERPSLFTHLNGGC